LFDEKLIVWSPVVVSSLIMSGIRAFIKMKHIESLLLPPMLFTLFMEVLLGNKNRKGTAFPLGFTTQLEPCHPSAM